MQGDELIRHVYVPFDVERPKFGLDLLAALMTKQFTAMPIASIGLDNSPGEGRYEAEFGRDALIMSALVEHNMPHVSTLTIRRLAELQGTTNRSDDAHSDREEHGRIIHEHRAASDPIAIQYSNKYGWQWPYFGSVDATPLFVSAVRRAARRDAAILETTVTQNDGIERSISQCLIKSVQWIERRLTRDPAGLLSNPPASNGCWQVWQDSRDAYHHHSGVLARTRIAAIEVQAMTYDALIDAAELARDGLVALDAQTLFALAQRVQASVLSRLWISGPDYFASALEYNEGFLRPLRVKTANMAMVLNSRLLYGTQYGEAVRAIVSHLTDPSELWSNAGVRTLARNEVRFHPMSYHNGSVWPWQNIWIARGLRRFGYNSLADDIDTQMRSIVDQTGCAPEMVPGTDKVHVEMIEDMVVVRSPDGYGNMIEHKLIRPSQRFQGWTVFGLLGLQSSESVYQETTVTR